MPYKNRKKYNNYHRGYYHRKIKPLRDKKSFYGWVADKKPRFNCPFCGSIKYEGKFFKRIIHSFVYAFGGRARIKVIRDTSFTNSQVINLHKIRRAHFINRMIDLCVAFLREFSPGKLKGFGNRPVIEKIPELLVNSTPAPNNPIIEIKSVWGGD